MPRSILKSTVPQSSSSLCSFQDPLLQISNPFPHVHFPPSSKLASVFFTHSKAAYDRSAIVVTPNACALPDRHEREFFPDVKVTPSPKGSHFHPRAHESRMPEPMPSPSPSSPSSPSWQSLAAGLYPAVPVYLWLTAPADPDTATDAVSCLTTRADMVSHPSRVPQTSPQRPKKIRTRPGAVVDPHRTARSRSFDDEGCLGGF